MKKYIFISAIAMMSLSTMAFGNQPTSSENSKKVENNAANNEVIFCFEPSVKNAKLAFTAFESWADDSVKKNIKVKYRNKKKSEKDTEISPEVFMVIYDNFSKYYNDSIYNLNKTIKDLENKRSQLDSVLSDNNKVLEQQRKKLSILNILISDSIYVFQRPLPDRDDIPTSLILHYKKIADLKEILTKANECRNRIDGIISNMKDKNTKSKIKNSIENDVSEWSGYIDQYNEMDIKDLSPEQKKHIKENLYDPFMAIVNEYF